MVTLPAKLSNNEANERADKAYATKIVKFILGQYPHGEPKDPETWLSAMIMLCTNIPKWVLKDMAHPVYGVMAASPKFLPSTAEVALWLKSRLPHLYTAPPPDHRLLLPEPEHTLSPEERARRAAVLEGVAEQLDGVMKRNVVVPPEQLEWLKPAAAQSAAQRRETQRMARRQIHDPQVLLDALVNIEGTKGNDVEVME